jgi:hypothetical protein
MTRTKRTTSPAADPRRKEFWNPGPLWPGFCFALSTRGQKCGTFEINGLAQNLRRLLRVETLNE